MGISHEYHSAPRRARRGTVSGKLRFLGAVVAILLVSYAITAILEKGAEGADDTPSTNASGIAENILAPLPMQGEADSSSAAQDGSTGEQAVTLENFGPAKQSAGAYTVKAYDASVIRQPSCGQVDLSYFADAAFLGDSLTVGFSDYQINLDGALICGYTGVGPDAIVNRSAVKSPTRGQEVALDVLANMQLKGLKFIVRHSIFLLYLYFQYYFCLQKSPGTDVCSVPGPEIQLSFPLGRAAVSVGRHIRAAEGSAQLWVRQIRSARALYIRPQRKFAWSSSFQISVILLALLSVVSPFFLFPLG